MEWSKYIAVNSATAHPHYGRDGSTYNMGNSYGTSGNASSLFATCLYTVMLSLLTSSGFLYNIIRVPPPEVQAAAKDSENLSGAEVICSIPASESRKPSYYHSFGEM